MAQVDYFLKIDGITGGSVDDKHAGEIECLSFNLTTEQEGAGHRGEGGGAGKAVFHDFSWSCHVDQAFPLLKQHVATGKHAKSAIFTVRQAGGSQQEYMKITFTNVLITEVEIHGGEHGAWGATPSKPASGLTMVAPGLPSDTKKSAIPVVRGRLNFSEVDFEFKPQKADGTLGAATKFGHSVSKNKPKG